MSLLIKALATAEKDKQAAQKKPRDADSATDLVLESLSAEAAPAGQNAAFEIAADASYDTSLSLLDDAGNLHHAADQQQTSASVAGKADTKPEKISAANKAAAFEATAAASVANVKLQAKTAKSSSQQAAAGVFVANQAVNSATSKSVLLLLGAAGALVIWLGLQGYEYFHKINAPAVAVVTPAPSVVSPVQQAPTVAADAAQPVVTAQEQVVSVDQNGVIAPAQVPANNTKPAVSAKAEVFKAAKANAVEQPAEDDAPVISSATAGKPLKNHQKSAVLALESDEMPHPKAFARGAPLKLVSRTPESGVDPTLLAAYQAYSRGDDAAAQQQYKQVLQNDVRNVDALLGLAAIAQRQGRNADASGWYQKVLEIEPRNMIAQSAVAGAQLNANPNDPVGTESRIKNMLAQHPDAANLHAALGNLYITQNQWASAQDAYFNASRFAPNNADYAFNLAVSLDQLGKSGLALAQYQRALEIIKNTGAASPDRSQLEARIRAIQAPD